MLRLLLLASVISSTVIASQSYSPPPPPNLPATLSPAQVAIGEALFERSVYVEGKVETYNYLGPIPCSACHDKARALKGESLAKKYGDLPLKINDEILKKSGGDPLPLRDPKMEALVQYLTKKYELYQYKLSQ